MKPSDKLEIPPVLHRKLEEFRSRLWSVKIGEGALAGMAGLIASFLAVFILERWIATPAWVRGALMFLGFAAPALIIPLRYHRWVWQKRSLEQIARVLRKRYPRLGDELLGVVDLARESGAKGHSSALVAAAMTQVAEKAKNEDFAGAVPHNYYRRWLTLSIGLLGLSLLMAAVVSAAAQNSAARWLTPWRVIERYTFAWLRPIEREMIVPFAERFDFAVRLQEESDWKPSRGVVRLPGNTKVVSNRDASGQYEFSVPPQKSDASITLRVGDADEEIRLKPMPRPELDHLSAKVRLPEYLRYQKDPVIPVQGASIQLVEGSSAVFIGLSNRPLAGATLNGEPLALSGATFSTRPLEASHTDPLIFEWRDLNGLSGKSPFQLRIQSIADQAPDIFAVKPGTEQVVLADEVLTFEMTSRDDFGLREIGLAWEGMADPANNPEVAAGSKRVATGAPEQKTIEALGTFSARRLGIKPQTVRVRAYAEDFHPSRGRVYSPYFVLHVMEPSEHATWLTNELAKWFNRAREVYEREQELHQSNRELRALSLDELESDENRARLERQAAAESSNARRLEALTATGRDLIRQAAKNNEFEAEKLETWAQTMRTLEEIAKNKMPSVADLLKQASQAPSGDGNPAKNEKTNPAPVSPEGAQPPSSPSKPAQDSDDAKKISPSSPSLSKQESSLDGKKPDESAEPSLPQNDPSPLSLPSTLLKAVSPEKQKKDGEKEKSAPSAADKLDNALEEQQNLLVAFSKVANELQQVLSQLEASTFVKRLKAASRVQIDIATALNNAVSNGFGMALDRIPVSAQDIAREASASELEESEKIRLIQTDLEAYFQRKQDAIYKNVLEQMRQAAVITRLRELGKEAAENLNGRAIAAAEFWADSLDRWAEELVAAEDSNSQDSQNQKSKNRKGLPPETVLEVMKLAREEMELRDETRELDTVKPSLTRDDFGRQAKELETGQAGLHERLDEVIIDLTDLPDGERDYAEELKLLRVVSDIMREARGILARPETGPEVIAAQTEVIELLLQSQRQPPQGGGGGGGGSSGGGGGGGSGNGSALSDIDVAPSSQSDPVSPSKRSVGQSTGKSGQEFPEEFRNGLDKYFNELERIR